MKRKIITKIRERIKEDPDGWTFRSVPNTNTLHAIYRFDSGYAIEINNIESWSWMDISLHDKHRTLFYRIDFGFGVFDSEFPFFARYSLCRKLKKLYKTRKEIMSLIKTRDFEEKHLTQ